MKTQLDKNPRSTNEKKSDGSIWKDRHTNLKDGTCSSGVTFWGEYVKTNK